MQTKAKQDQGSRGETGLSSELHIMACLCFTRSRARREFTLTARSICVIHSNDLVDSLPLALVNHYGRRKTCRLSSSCTGEPLWPTEVACSCEPMLATFVI